jgi:hypothetical protein
LEVGYVVIVSCFVGYIETSIAYNKLWKIVVSRDVKFGEDVRSSNSHVSPSVLEGSEEIVFLEVDLEVRA